MRNFSFNQMSDVELFISAGVVVQRCVNQPFLLALGEPMDAVTTHFSIFSSALTHVRKSGVDFLPADDGRRANLIAALDNLHAGIAQFLLSEKGSAPACFKADFDVFNSFFVSNAVRPPTHVSVSNAARCGYVRVCWLAVADGVMYHVEHRREGDTVWQSSRHSTQSLILLSGFERGAYFEFRLCALGEDQTRSPWTQPVGIRVA